MFNDYITGPFCNPNFSQKYGLVDVKLDFYSKFWDMAIMIVATLLAVIVHIQQRWTYQELRQKLKLGPCKLLPSASGIYGRLPSNSFEAELISGAIGTASNSHMVSLE